MSPTEEIVRSIHDRQCSQCGKIVNLTKHGYRHEGTFEDLCRGAQAQKIDPNWKPPVRKCQMELSPEDCVELSEWLGTNVNDRRDMKKAVKNLTTLSVNGTEITLEPYLLERLHSRCHSTDDWNEFLKRIIVEQLCAYAGC